MNHSERIIDLAIFDFAGTIVDHGVFAPVEALRSVFAENGIELTMPEARGPMGIHKRDHIRMVLYSERVAGQWRASRSAPDENTVERLYRRMAELQPARILEHNTAITGTSEIFASLRSQGIKIGGTTGYTRVMLDVAIEDLKRQGVELDHVVAADEIPAGRPAGYGCWSNALSLQAPCAYRCVKIGDTVPDVLEGLNAGMWSIGVYQSGNGVGLCADDVLRLPGYPESEILHNARQELADAGAHEVIPGIWDLQGALERIAARIGRGERP